MYKILIVDDEKLLRQGFISMTDWQQHDFDIVGEASNGKEAIEKINALVPDIVVTDIKMPIMDGVALTRYIKEHFPWIEVVVLSSFDDFDYVKETMKHGAADYILKPTMEYSELLQVLQKISCKLDKYSLESSDDQKANSTKLLASPQSFLDYYPMNAHTLIYNNFILLLYTPINNMDSDIWSTLTTNDITCLPCIHDNIGICLINFDNRYLVDINNHINSFMIHLNCDIWFFKSNIYHQLKLTEEKYNILMQKLDFRFYLDKNTVISEDHTLLPRDFFSIDFKSLLPSIAQRDYNQLIELIFSDIQKKIRNNYYIKEDHLKNTLIETYFFIKNTLSEDYDMTEISFMGPEHLQLIHNAVQYNELMSSYDKILSDIFHHVDDQRYKRYGGIIGDVIDYMRNNYDKDITLNSIANLFHLNKSYLCELFKQQTGENFSKYLANIRIKNAKRLLKQSDYSVYQISEIVGFKDSSYFGKVFKNITGISPLKYGKKNTNPSSF